MGYGFRVFLVKEDNSIKKIPTAKFDRLWDPENNERWLPYASQRIRYAKVVLDFKKRKPESILHVDYGYLVFDSEGKLDQKSIDDEMRLAANLLPPVSNEFCSPNVIHSEDRFAKKKYKNLYSWEPDTTTKNAIFDSALGLDNI